MTLILSDGGGTQSTGMIALIVQGKLPRPDIAAIVDTGREKTATWEYVEQVHRPALASVGVELHVVSHDYATADLMTAGGKVLMPMYTTHSGNLSKLPTYCSDKWKKRPLMRWLREQGVTKGRQWLGISIDEADRMKPSGVQWLENAFPLIDLGLSRDDCYSLVRQMGWPDPPKSSCLMCFTGDTEVVTRDGIKSIASLAGTNAELLVPKLGSRGGASEIGSFVTAPVRSFGHQETLRLHISRGKMQKVIGVTAEHRWLLAAGPQWRDAKERWTTTSGLKPGDKLANLFSTSMVNETPMPLAVMQGFVFGDGTKASGKRPGTLTLHAGKDEALLPLFSICNPVRRKTSAGADVWQIYGFPRTWKHLPDIRESRPFLLGWLAGYFAADGTVSKKGIATLHSATREHLEFVRDVCAVLGVRTASITQKMRVGKGKEASALYGISLSTYDLPPSFFYLEHHRKRVDAKRDPRRTQWTVEAVIPTGQVEEVFCATVDGVGAFGLADGLMTGNCPHMGDAQWRHMKATHPQDFEAAVQVERELQRSDPTLFLHRSAKPLDLVPWDEQPTLFDEDTLTCQASGCWT